MKSKLEELYFVNFSARAYIRGEVLWKMTIDPPWPSPVEQQVGLSTSLNNSCKRACSGAKIHIHLEFSIFRPPVLEKLHKTNNMLPIVK